MDEASDEVLMERFCQGDEAAFETLFARHGAQVKSYLRRLSGSAASADDLTQATFLSLVRARGRFTPGSLFRPWLYAIATNAARDLSRRRKHEVFEPAPDSDEAVEQEPGDPGFDRAVQRALAQLPEAQRAAVVLHRFEGLSFAEIALAEGVSESAVKVRAHRGYERLRQLLADFWKAHQP